MDGRVIYNGLTLEVVDPASIKTLHPWGDFDYIITVACRSCKASWKCHRLAWSMGGYHTASSCNLCGGKKTVEEIPPGGLL